MKRFFLVSMPVYVLFACTIASTATVPPARTPTETQISPAHFETNSIISGDGQSTGIVETPLPREVGVFVYFTMSDDVEMTPVPVARIVQNSDKLATIIHSTMEELLKGPTDAEKAKGLISWFSLATAHLLVSVTGSGGEIAVDFTGFPSIIPNASTSAGSQMLLSELNSTVFQFPAIQNIHYTLDSGCAAFWEWLQYDCHSVTRADWEQV